MKNRPISKIFLFSFLLQSVLATAQSGRIPVSSENGIVSSSHHLASNAGAKILAEGGNAVDASIATAFALAVTLPSAGNIGGGGFMIYRGSDGTETSFNFREKAPLAATETMYLDENGKVKNNTNHEGLLAVGVPGTVAGLWKAHQKYGKSDWKDLLKPALKLAKKGFPVNEDMQWFFEGLKEHQEEYASTAKVFLKKNGEIYKNGEILIQKDLFKTLKRIQKKGAEGFYKGKTAELLTDFMAKNGGIITDEDLVKYEAEEMQPIKGTYRDYEIIGMPPPSSGGVAVIEMLNILEGYNMTEFGQNSANSLHVITEAMRRAFADRAMFLGDSNFNPNMPLSKLTSKNYAEKLRNSIQMEIASKSDSANFNKAHLKHESKETTHISVVDKDGNAVSMTYTLEQSYGSKHVVEGAGFLLNNEMGDFNPIPGYTNAKGLIGTDPNLIAPEKRMLSSMSPTIVAKNGKTVLVIGSPGGRTIINTVLQVILNTIDYNLDIAKAIESPRIHHQWLPDTTYFEEWGFSPDTKRIYEEMGHEIDSRSTQGRAMGIYIDPETGMRYGAADSRSYNGAAAIEIQD
ncbi:gamma-glutamyltransferase [Zunongwangia endophytica]|uniref:Glutathione hydrolase proenzyme n=1 Tax=Zunongwangia endophytica TaxID=1808945 RepID=A0ABV8HEN3_9FLAO|nr:gamma-glutamyltransferase [Zunongwangia endophytica]MDN3593680.1 gamma-glutamyltransferase [Zunongwangia endophytica]